MSENVDVVHLIETINLVRVLNLNTVENCSTIILRYTVLDGEKKMHGISRDSVYRGSDYYIIFTLNLYFGWKGVLQLHSKKWHGIPRDGISSDFEQNDIFVPIF